MQIKLSGEPQCTGQIDPGLGQELAFADGYNGHLRFDGSIPAELSRVNNFRGTQQAK
jgi:hypothetical protein